MKKALTKREVAQAMNFWATSHGKPTQEVPKKRELKHSDEPTEHQLQVRVIAWWAKWHGKFGLPEFALYAVPNGGSRHMLEAVNLKKEGVRRGIPDLQLDVPRNGYHGLRIEMKRKGGVVSDEQKQVHQFLKSQGYACIVAWSDEEAIEAVKEYLENAELRGRPLLARPA